jgi:ketosteroid isomerase-like protein
MTAVEVVRRCYEAFGKGDVPGILEYVAPEIDWEFIGPKQLAYCGPRRTRSEAAAFFADVARLDEIHAFEPREFIESGNNVTVLGWESTTARDTGVKFATEWIHLFTVRDGRIVRWRGSCDTGSRYLAP